MPQVDLVPISIGHYSDPGLPDLDVETQVGRLADLLAPFGGRLRAWPAPTLERGASVVERRLLDWATTAPRAVDPDGLDSAAGAAPGDGSVLYWVGHGWSDGTRAALAHTDSPARVGAAGVTPDQLADAIRTRQAATRTDDRGGGWALVVVDTCRSQRFVQLLAAALMSHDPPQQVLLVGVSAAGATTLGRFTDALRTVLHTTYRANGRIPLTDLATQLTRVLSGCEMHQLGDLTDAALVPVYPPVASWMSAPLDTVRHLEDVLKELSPDERRHFLVKAQGAEYGELSWYFHGRHTERTRISTWLHASRPGMLVVSGRAGSGKSALLGNLLVHSLPDLRDALARRGLTEPPPAEQTPPPQVFDAVIHLSSLTLPQITARIATAAGLDPLPSTLEPATGIAGDLDWLTDQLAHPDTTTTRPRRLLTVLADALDEATDPLDTAASLLARIAALPTVRVLVGTRVSTHETPDAPAADTNLLDALTRTRPEVDHTPGQAGRDSASVVWVAHDPDAIHAYATARLTAARDHGRRGHAIPGMTHVINTDIHRVAAAIAAQQREFLHARLAVYELIEEPRLLLPERAGSLTTLLAGDHQDLFAKALDRLARLDDRYPTLIHALAVARGRGIPEADGIWATIATALTHNPPQNPHAGWDPDGQTAPPEPVNGEMGAGWAQAIDDLLTAADAYIIIDTPNTDRQPATGHDVKPATLDDQDTGPDDNPIGSRAGTVFRLAHRTFVEYFTTHPRDAAGPQQDQGHAASALLDAAARVAAGPAGMPAYLARHLSGHIADTDRWDVLAAHPRVLDGLDPYAVTADAIRTLFGRRTIPPPVAGVIGARDTLATAYPTDRPGLRQLATTTHSTQQAIGEPAVDWAVPAAQAGRVTMHVRLTGHTGGVNKVVSLRLLGRGTILASASDDGTIRLWDPTTATPIGTPIVGHAGSVEGLVAIRDPYREILLVSTSTDSTIRIWDPVSGRQVGDTLTGHTGEVWGVCVLPDTDLNGQPGRTLLATTGEDGTVRVWDPIAGIQVGDPLAGHAGAVWGVCALPGAGPAGTTLLATTGYDGTIRLWTPTAGREIGNGLTGHTGPVWALCTLPGADEDGRPDGRILMATGGYDGTVRIWDPFTGRQVGGTLTGHTGAVWGLCALSSGDLTGESDAYLLVSSGADGTIRIWDPVTGRQVGDPLTGHTGLVAGVYAVSGGVNSDGRSTGRTLLATGGADGTIRIWDPVIARQADNPLTHQTGPSYGVCALPDTGTGPDSHLDGTTLLATTGYDGAIRIWDPVTGRQAGSPLTGHTGGVWGVCALPSTDATEGSRSTTLLTTTGYDGTVRIWDPVSRRSLGDPLVGHVGPVGGVCTLPGTDEDSQSDGRTLLATAGFDGTLRIWDPVTGRQVREPLTGHAGGVWDVCALPQSDESTGRWAAGRTHLATSGYDATIRIWDPVTGRQMGEPLTGHSGLVSGLCAVREVGPDDKPGRILLASGGADGTIRIWDPVIGRQIGDPMTGHTGRIYGICILPSTGAGSDEHPGAAILLATTGADGTVRVWDLGTRQQLGGPLTGHLGVVWGVCALPSTGPPGRSRATMRLATTGYDGTVRLWDPVSGWPIGDPLSSSSATTSALALGNIPGVDCLVLAADGTVRTWTTATATLAPASAPRHTSALATHALGDRKVLISGDTTGHLHTTDLGTGRRLLESVQVDHSAILALQPLPSPQGAIAAAGGSGTIVVRHHNAASTRPRQFTGHMAPVRALCLVPPSDNTPLLLASAGDDATIRFWNLDTGRPVGRALIGHDGWIWALGAPPDQPGHPPQLASAGADATVRLWNPHTARQIGQPLTGHTDQVRALTYATTPDGRTLLISGSHDGTIRLWHPDTGTAIHTIPLGLPIHALLAQPPTPQTTARTQGGATLTVGLRTGILTLDLHHHLFPTIRQT